MNFTKFSAEAFERCGLDSEAAQTLADELEHEVVVELMKEIRPRMEAIIRRLNSLGHRFERDDRNSPGSCQYADWSKVRRKENSLLDASLVVSTGYAHLVDLDDDDADLWGDEEP